jgi:hypothetical protein
MLYVYMKSGIYYVSCAYKREDLSVQSPIVGTLNYIVYMLERACEVHESDRQEESRKEIFYTRLVVKALPLLFRTGMVYMINIAL